MPPHGPQVPVDLCTPFKTLKLVHINMSAVVSLLSLLDEKRTEAEQECDDLAAQCNKWLAETRQQTEQQMLYRT